MNNRAPLPFIATEYASVCGAYRARRGTLGWMAARWDGSSWELLGEPLLTPEEAMAVCTSDLEAELQLAPTDISF